MPDALSHLEKAQLLEYLKQFISENKNRLFQKNINNRTRYLSIVLEDIFQPHNASAVLRTCDCFGIQDVHIIENQNKYEVNPDVALGSSKWLTLNRYNNTLENTSFCLRNLKKQGYRIIATTPHKNDFTPETLPLNEKIALVFGTEKDGLSEIALNLADDYVRIPMYGFTESFNISVSAALLVRALIERLHQSSLKWQLSKEEALDIQLSWVRAVIRNPDPIEKAFLKKLKTIQSGTSP
ncbi:MAG: RNA methyltransferase [Bacteroidetes bacterium]|nr:RNA methyltransferase [Bacteroidota bacterium]